MRLTLRLGLCLQKCNFLPMIFISCFSYSFLSNLFRVSVFTPKSCTHHLNVFIKSFLFYFWFPHSVIEVKIYDFQRFNFLRVCSTSFQNYETFLGNLQKTFPSFQNFGSRVMFSSNLSFICIII